MRVGIGPTNTAGQGYRLAKALREAGIDAESFGKDWQHKAPLIFPCDRPFGPNEWGTPAWAKYVDGFSHHLLWNGLSPYGPNRWFSDDRFAHAALVFRGSELRIPHRHAAFEPWSPFPAHPLTAKLERKARRLHARLRGNRLPAFVATLEMVDYLPGAKWLPIIADAVPAKPPMRRKRPVVLHVATNDAMKGSAVVDALDLLQIELRRPGLMPLPQMLAAIADADIVIGNLLIGDYGGTEIQAMAAGRLVVAKISERVLARSPEYPPIKRATPETLRQTIVDLIKNREQAEHLSEQAREYHATYHDGRYSVAQLGGFLRWAS